MRILIQGRNLFGIPRKQQPPRYYTFMKFLFNAYELTLGTSPPNDRGCRICGKIGHRFKDCPNRRQNRIADRNRIGPVSPKNENYQKARDSRQREIQPQHNLEGIHQISQIPPHLRNFQNSYKEISHLNSSPQRQQSLHQPHQSFPQNFPQNFYQNRHHQNMSPKLNQQQHLKFDQHPSPRSVGKLTSNSGIILNQTSAVSTSSVPSNFVQYQFPQMPKGIHPLQSAKLPTPPLVPPPPGFSGIETSHKSEPINIPNSSNWNLNGNRMVQPNAFHQGSPFSSSQQLGLPLSGSQDGIGHQMTLNMNNSPIIPAFPHNSSIPRTMLLHPFSQSNSHYSVQNMPPLPPNQLERPQVLPPFSQVPREISLQQASLGQAMVSRPITSAQIMSPLEGNTPASFPQQLMPCFDREGFGMLSMQGQSPSNVPSRFANASAGIKKE